MSRSASGPSTDMSCSGAIEHYRADIDGLRAVAVLAVVGFHAFPGVVQAGFIGVDIFFVISGFLISSILFKSLACNNLSILDFYARRVRRIFPALVIVLLFCLGAGWFLLLPSDYAQLGKHVSAGAVFISNLVLWSEAGYFDQASHAKPLLHLWSLGIEEQFYLFYPLILALTWKVRKVAGWALFLVTLASFVLNIHLMATDISATFYSPLTRFWELSIGGLIAFQRYDNSSSAASVSAATKSGVSLVGAGLILLAAVLLSNKSTFPGWWACLPVLGAGALLWAGPQALVNRYVFSNRILVWIGLISYPLYLWHWPLLTFAQIDASEPTTRLMRISIVMLSVLLAWLTYRFIEQPIRRRSLSKAMTSVLLSVLLATGLLGLLVYQSSGAPARMPLFIQQLSALEFDHTIRTRVGTCFLLTGQTSKDFSNCLDEKVAGRPSVLLIGDSHASHLYPGLSTRFGHEANIIQRTAGFCPPMFGPKTETIGKLCKDVIEYTQQLIRQQHPQVVILSANWLFYELTELKQTIQWLRAVGVKKIIVVGPVPQWRESLVRQLYQQYRKTDQAEVPSRLLLGLNPDVFIVDRQMAEIAIALEVEYISPQHLLCDTKGCLTRYGESLETLITWDYGHLTNGASEYLVSKFPDIK